MEIINPDFGRLTGYQDGIPFKGFTVPESIIQASGITGTQGEFAVGEQLPVILPEI